VSIDAAFFDDGTFVGPDTSNFFAQTKAVVSAKRDFLNELAAEVGNSGKTTDSFDQRLQQIATQSIESLDSSSTPTDYYNFFKKLCERIFANERDRGSGQRDRVGDASIQQTLGYAA
jgi:hypothetical protein